MIRLTLRLNFRGSVIIAILLDDRISPFLSIPGLRHLDAVEACEGPVADAERFWLCRICRRRGSSEGSSCNWWTGAARIASHGRKWNHEEDDCRSPCRLPCLVSDTCCFTSLRL